MTMPEVIDVHVHLTRDPAQEQLVFPKPGYPEEWYRANEPRVISWMDAEGFSHLFMINYMDTNRMIAARLARMAGVSEAALEGARAQLQEEHVERLRRFNAWACELGAREPRIIPFPCVDIGIFYDVTVMMEELEARLVEGARGIKLHPGLGHYFPGDERMFPLYERLQEADIPILSDTGSLSPAPEGGVYGEPLNFVPVFEQFPRLRFIMAHAASAFWDERVLIAGRFRTSTSTSPVASRALRSTPATATAPARWMTPPASCARWGSSACSGPRTPRATRRVRSCATSCRFR